MMLRPSKKSKTDCCCQHYAPNYSDILNDAFVHMAEYKIDIMHHQVEIIDTKMPNNTFCILQNTTIIIRQSRTYDDINDFVPQLFLYPLKDVVCIINFAACPNILEAVFYTHIFWYNKR